jgi:hypothetical protein
MTLKNLNEKEWKAFQKRVENKNKLRDSIGVCFFSIILKNEPLTVQELNI